MQLVGALVPPSPPSRHPQRQLGCGSTRLLIQQAPTRDALTHRAAQTNANSERGDETRACKASKDIHTRTHNTRALARVLIESATIEHPIHRQRIATPHLHQFAKMEADKMRPIELQSPEDLRYLIGKVRSAAAQNLSKLPPSQDPAMMQRVEELLDDVTSSLVLPFTISNYLRMTAII
jgi:hypothetical protein